MTGEGRIACVEARANARAACADGEIPMIRYVDTLDGITADGLGGFFEGWRRPVSPEEHLAAMAGSDEIVLAADRETGEVVGFITAISDGVLSAHIPLLEVLRQYRGRGIGAELLRRMLARLERFYAVDVVCDGALRKFYEAHGMAPATAMVLRRHDRPPGRGRGAVKQSGRASRTWRPPPGRGSPYC